jgi:hypothetical protein
MNDDKITRASSRAHEPLGVSVRGLSIGAACLALLVAGSLWLTWQLAAALTSQRSADAKPNAEPTAEFRGRTSLDPGQRARRLQYEAEQRDVLNRYEWGDAERAFARVPIERAMRLVEKRYQASSEEKSP